MGKRRGPAQLEMPGLRNSPPRLRRQNLAGLSPSDLGWNWYGQEEWPKRPLRLLQLVQGGPRVPTDDEIGFGLGAEVEQAAGGVREALHRNKCNECKHYGCGFIACR